VSLKKFDKYALYTEAVQSPDTDIPFFYKRYIDHRGKKPKIFREDFCGTFALCRSWVKMGKDLQAIGVDLDPEPIAYGMSQMEKLKPDQQKRIQILNKNVFDKNLPSADVVVALNFSHFIIKERTEMIRYFKSVKKSLKKDGIMIIDCFGGSQVYEPNEEFVDHTGFTYYWDQDSWDPVTSRAQFYIHFKIDGKEKVKKVFSYDWRVWTIPELREIFLEAGFKKTTVYWEGTTKKGEGDGNFKPSEKGEDCESWIAYIVAE